MRKIFCFVFLLAVVSSILAPAAKAQTQKDVVVTFVNLLNDDVKITAVKGSGTLKNIVGASAIAPIVMKSGEKLTVLTPGGNVALGLKFEVLSGSTVDASQTTIPTVKKTAVKYYKIGTKPKTITISESLIKGLTTIDLKADFVPDILWDNKTGLDIQVISKDLKESGITITAGNQSFVSRRNKVGFISAEIVCLADDNLTEFHRVVKIPITVNNDNALITLDQRMLFEDMDEKKVKVSITNNGKTTLMFRWCILGEASASGTNITDSQGTKALATNKVVIAPGSSKIISVPKYGSFTISGENGTTYKCYRPMANGERLVFYRGRLLSKSEYKENLKIYGE